MIHIHTVVQQPYATNCYILSDGKGSIIIDPGDVNSVEKIKEEVMGELYAVILTHLHFDHSAAAHLFDVPCYIHEKEFLDQDYQKMLTKQALGKDLIMPKNIQYLQEQMTFGGIQFSVIETPGHTKGGVCLLFEDFIISGDTLFARSYGRTDLGGNEKDLIASLKKLAALPEELLVYPGHGPSTSIRAEKEWILKIPQEF